ncbi:MFS transporter, DHA2 family, multidrug resistance protein [Saccharopolyspora kobensis]|uniref:MFS transporter, DHA2 family, multidrug resistance protein n=1 Tax=Saccharopolyspora kobensis TaxID=146035 RepID=A0A1H6DS88_9PSEU|nr:MFS transporter [Saccharopolyspora kobensis]SEG88098.1 MFS transporter, DHA2 family, multidrug resistance protein [Saccharopolyspora kobensis]SFE03067.1 MFS transporter, DHA2 family, multidrug resistance protein [Saccharopolyspora kobensis]
MTNLKSPSTSRRQWAALGALLLPVLLISVDNTVLSFAVPHISEELRPSGGQLLWIVDIYSLMLAGLLVTMGTLGDRIGRRRLLLIGATGFGLASVLAAFAPSAELLIAARALLGVAGATLMPSTLSLIRNIFTDPRARTTAIAAWTATFAGGAAFGPLLGGLLLEHFWWGSVFLINLPVMVLLLIVGPLVIPESRNPNPGRYDLPSAGLSLLAMLALVLGVKEFAGGGSLALPAVAVALIAGCAFVRRQRRLDDPMLDLGLFAKPRFSVAVASNLLAVFVMVGGLFFMTQYLQLVLGMSPLRAGLALLPGIGLSVVGSLVAVRLIRRVRLAELLGAAMFATGLGYLLMVLLPSEGSAWLVVVAFMIVGVSAGITETATNDTIMNTVAPENAGAASAISETGYELGAALGTAVLGSVVTAAYRSHVDVTGLPESIVDAAQDTLGGALAVAGELPLEQAVALRDSAAHAFTHGVHVTSVVGAVVLAFAAFQAWWVLSRR